MVYKKSPSGCIINVCDFDCEVDAIDFCDRNGWELTDENEFVWELDYKEEV